MAKTREERALYLWEIFSNHQWFRVIRNEKPYLDLTREDCDLIAELLAPLATTEVVK